MKLYFFHSFFYYIFHAAAQGKNKKTLCRPHAIHPHTKLEKQVY